MVLLKVQPTSSWSIKRCVQMLDILTEFVDLSMTKLCPDSGKLQVMFFFRQLNLAAKTVLLSNRQAQV